MPGEREQSSDAATTRDESGEPIEPTEILDADADLPVRVRRREPEPDLPSFARSAGDLAISASIVVARSGLALGRAVVGVAARTPPVRLASEMLGGALDAVVGHVAASWDGAAERTEEQVRRVVAVVVPVVIESIDIKRLMDAIDMNALLEEIDVNAIVERLDIDALLGKVDVAGIARRANIGELVAESTQDVAGSAIDVGRRQAVALDTLVARAVDRVLGRDRTRMPPGPQQLVENGEVEA